MGFLPVGFAKSGVAEYCFSLFAVVAISLLVSWIVAVIFTPFIGAALLKEQPAGHGHAAKGRIARWFERALLLALRRLRTSRGASASYTA